MRNFKELIEKYHAGTLDRDELIEMQKLLTQNEAFRREFLLYSQVEVTLANQVLFHNELERPIESNENSSPISTVPPVPCNESLLTKMCGIVRLNLGEI